MHLDVVISLYRSVYLQTSSGNRIAFFLLHRFLFIPVREMIAKTLMCITFFLSLYLSSSSLKEQCHDSRIQFLRVWDEENLADLIIALRQTLNVDERTVIDTIHQISVRSRETQRVSRWYASHKAVPVRFALLWRWSSFSSTTCIGTTLQKDHF